ncbi:MAG: hypothetical protein J2P46_19805 [Zavarzinella sp.]|nr:hypothetical protein [Zavarzinella sp.]
MDDWDEPPDDEGPLAWERRVYAVALFWSVPGVVAGALAGLFLSAADLIPVWVPMAAGGGLGLLTGGLLEADHLG